jgi:hypothetical protein
MKRRYERTLVPTAYFPKKPRGRNRAIAILSTRSAKPFAIPIKYNGRDFLISRLISLQDVLMLAFVWTSRISPAETTEVTKEIISAVNNAAAILT